MYSSDGRRVRESRKKLRSSEGGGGKHKQEGNVELPEVERNAKKRSRIWQEATPTEENESMDDGGAINGFSVVNDGWDSNDDEEFANHNDPLVISLLDISLPCNKFDYESLVHSNSISDRDSSEEILGANIKDCIISKDTETNNG